MLKLCGFAASNYYNKGTNHLVSGSHYVKCTDEEFAKWCK